MAEPHDVKDLEACGEEVCTYDFAQAERIIRAMDSLRSEAVKTNIEEIVTIVDANFRLLVTTYCCILRYEMTKLGGNDMVQ
jgi:hypothetical protein